MRGMEVINNKFSSDKIPLSIKINIKYQIKEHSLSFISLNALNLQSKILGFLAAGNLKIYTCSYYLLSYVYFVYS